MTLACPVAMTPPGSYRMASARGKVGSSTAGGVPHPGRKRKLLVAAAPDGTAQAQGVDQAILGVGGRQGQRDGARWAEAVAPGLITVAAVARDEHAGVGRHEERSVLGEGDRGSQSGDGEDALADSGAAPDGAAFARTDFARVRQWLEHPPTEADE